MRNNTHHIKLTSSGLWAPMAVFILMLLSCNRNEIKHEGHDQKTETSKHEASQHDAMEGMQMNKERTTDTAGNETYWNAMSTNRTVISAQKVIEPIESDMDFVFNGNGYISFDWRRNHKVPVRIGGRIEKLYIKYNYQYVRKGEKIIEIFSPEINTYFEELLYVNRTNDTSLQSKAKQKLLLLGLTPTQIKQIEQTGQAPFTISVYSPFEGYVLFNPSALPGMEKTGSTATGMGGGMTGGGSAASSILPTILSDNSIREGMYVSKDQTLFWINDFKQVWGIVAFTKENEKYLRKGLPVSVTSELLSEKDFQTSIQFIEQVYQGGQKFSQARVYLSNVSGILKQNSLIRATASIPAKSLMVPASSVYYLGKIAIVWVRTGETKEGSNIFQSRVVRIGHRDSKMVQILEGLNAGELVAKDAGYMADSETIIKY